jgi:membrane protease YdiL (CAAX protease family)
MDDTTSGTLGEAQSAPAAPGAARLTAELLLIFGGVPGLLILFRHHVNGLIIPMILVAALGCWLWLRRQADFDRQLLWNWSALRRNLLRRMAVFAPLALVAAGLCYWYAPHLFLLLPRDRTGIWLIIMVAYPVLSAYPQEIIYRAFFLQRYRTLFRNEFSLILVNALLFAMAHAFLGNWLAPALTFAGGILFCRTYLRSGSLALAALEHGLWGDLLFTLGVGYYLYAGSIG